MRIRLAVAASIFPLCFAACTAPNDGGKADGARAATTTAGDATTVVNESGSVWGGAARLAEEASIGVEAGGDEYLLGRVRGLAFHANRIYVLDSQVPVVRVYDADGRHLQDIGGEGQGPGEFTQPNSLAVGDGGRTFVRDQSLGRINVYGPDGKVSDTLAIASNFGTSTPDVAAADGFVYTPVQVGEGDLTERRTGMQGLGVDGSALDPIVPPPLESEASHVVIRRGAGTSMVPLPFAPGYVWSMTPEAAWVVGVGNAYRFEVRHQDGRQLVVERLIDPVAVDPDEHAYQTGVLRARIQRIARDDGSVEGADPGDIPRTKPFFYGFVPGHEGRIWVLREGPGVRDDECGENEEPASCWSRTGIVDAFDAEGHFLGEIDLPDGVQLSTLPALHGDAVVALYQDEAGTIMVKRYRLVLPGE